MGRRLTLIAGSGSFPPQIAAEIARAGDPLQIIEVVGRGDLVGDVRHIPVSDPAALDRAVREFHTTHIVWAGSLRFTDADRAAAAGAMGAVGRLLPSHGDIPLALGALLHFRLAGIRMLGADKIVPNAMVPEGLIAGPPVDDMTTGLAHRALAAARQIGRIDLGQAVVSSGRRVIAAEDAGGTDALLSRTATLVAQEIAGGATGPLILAKAKKPHQPRFMDLPAIGASTIRNAAAAGVSIIAVEAANALLLEREELIAAADAAGVSVVGLRV